MKKKSKKETRSIKTKKKEVLTFLKSMYYIKRYGVRKKIVAG